jgi:hypothetical protein
VGRHLGRTRGQLDGPLAVAKLGKRRSRQHPGKIIQEIVVVFIVKFHGLAEVIDGVGMFADVEVRIST